MKFGSFVLGIIGAFIIFFLSTNVFSLQTFIGNSDFENDVNNVGNIKNIPKKNDLIGTYIVKKDKQSNISLKEDGTYTLTINACDNYLLLTGKYELMDSKLKLYNESNLMYEDLAGNMELSFTIVNDNTIKSLEKLVCTEEGTLFEK